MTLRWREFEKRARKLIAVEISHSSQLKKQKRRAPRRDALRKILGLFLPVYALLAIALGYGRWASKALGSAPLLAVLVSVPATLYLAATWLGHLKTAAEPIWRALPLSREQLFANRIRTFWKDPIYLTILVATGYIGIFASGEIENGPRLFFLITLQVMMICATALHLAAFFGERRSLLSMGTVVSIALLAIGPKFPEAIAAVRDNLALIYTFLPGCWVQRAVSGRDWTDWIYLLPIGLALAATVQSFRRIRARFYAEPFWNEDVVVGWADADDYETDETASPLEEHDASVSENHSNPTVNVRQWPREGIIEWVADKLWKQKDRATANFLWPNRRNWTAAWKRSAKWMLICLVLSASAQSLFGWPVVSICFLVLGALGSLMCAPLFSGATGLRGIPHTGSFSPLYSVFPISYDSMYRELRVPSLVRWAAWTLLIIGFIVPIAFWTEFSVSQASLAVVKISFLFPALLPLFTAIWIGQHTTTWRVRWIWCYVPLGIIVFFAIAVYVVEVFELVDDPPTGKIEAGILAAIWLLAKVTQLLHRHIFRHRGLDLSHRPQAPYSS